VPPAKGPSKGERPGAAHQGVDTPRCAHRGRFSSVAYAGRPLSRVLRPPCAGRTATADGLWLGSMV